MFKDKKIIILLAILIIVVAIGAITIPTIGFNYNLMYDKHISIGLNINSEFNKQDIINLSKEVLQTKKVYVQTINETDTMLAITTKEITDEQKEALIQKVNEKYSLELTVDDLEITEYAQVSFLDIIMPYLSQTIAILIVILIYLLIKYRKIGIIKVFIDVVCKVFIVLGIYIDIIVCTRIPINRLTMPIALLLLIATIIGETVHLENKKEI